MTAVSLGTALAHAGNDNMMWGDGPGWGWLWGATSMLILLAAVLGAVWLIVRAGRRPGHDDAFRARDILAERYARGELTTEQYQQRLAALR